MIRRTHATLAALVVLAAARSVGAQPMVDLPPVDQAEIALSPQDAVARLLVTNSDVALARLAVREAASRRLGAEAIFAWQFGSEFNASFAQQPVDDGFTSGVGEAQQYDLGVSIGRQFGPGTSVRLALSQGVSRTVFPLATEFGSRDIVRGPNVSTGLTLSASQPLLRGRGRRITTLPLLTAEAALSIDELAVAESASTALSAALDAWVEVRFARDTYAQRLRSIDRTEVQLVIAEAELEAGRIAPIDVDRVRERLAANREAALLAWSLVEQRSLQLAQAIGESPDVWRTVEPSGSLPAFGLPADDASRCAMARAASPALATLEARRDAVALDRARTTDALLPSLELTGGVTQSGLDPNTGAAWAQLARLEARTLFAGLVFSMPLGNEAARDEHERASIAVERAELAYNDVARALCFDVTASSRELTLLQERVAILDFRVGVASRTVDAEQARFTRGQSTVQAGLEALEQLDFAEGERIRLDADAALATLRIAQATGRLARDLLPADSASAP